MHDGFGGVNVMAIKSMLELHGLNTKQQRYCIDRIVAYLTALTTARAKAKAKQHG